MIRMRVAMVAADAEGSPVLVLQPIDEAEQGLVLPIWIGPMETAAILIAAGLSGQPARPLTYDLMVRLLDALHGEVERVAVTDLVAGTFHATITLRTPDGLQQVDARPSDSIALALRVGAPIFVADAVMAQAGIPDMTEDTPEDEGAPEDATLARFSDFIEQVDPEDFRN